MVLYIFRKPKKAWSYVKGDILPGQCERYYLMVKNLAEMQDSISNQGKGHLLEIFGTGKEKKPLVFAQLLRATALQKLMQCGQLLHRELFCLCHIFVLYTSPKHQGGRVCLVTNHADTLNQHQLMQRKDHWSRRKISQNNRPGQVLSQSEQQNLSHKCSFQH